MIKTKLFCLPYAGGSGEIYNSWGNFLDDGIDLTPLEFAGRGSRIHESPYEKRSDAVDDIFEIIKLEIQEVPYMIFGHSLGALVAYEVIQKIALYRLPIPVGIFFSGSGAPHLRNTSKIYHLLDEREFTKELLNLGGTPPEFFEYPELTRLFLPIIKNDFKLAETNLLGLRTDPIDQDIVILYGEDDIHSIEQLNGWKEYTKEKCYYHGFAGGHFFIKEKKAEIIEVINKRFIQSRIIQDSA